MTPRQAALLSVNSCIKNGRYSNIELSTVIKKYKFEGLDKSFFTALFYGTIEKMITIDYCIEKISKRKTQELDNMVLCLVRTGLYQILFMDRVPDSAACNESVELAKRYCPKSSVGFVNAVLRTASRSKDKLFDMMKREKGLYSHSLISGVPLEILESWENDYGKDKAKSLARYFGNYSQSMTLRVNSLKITRERMLDSLGNIASPSKNCESAIKLSGSFPVEELYGFREGLFFLQDEASQIAMSLINTDSVPEGGLVLDLCACPGGKSFSAAINLGGKCRIISRDLHENKLSLVMSGAERLGISDCMEISAHDARVTDEALLGKADAVICDVPCSGLGVIAKKPDIKFKPLSETARLPEIQKAILDTAKNYVKKSGFIVYSTCTLKAAENEDIVNRFLEENDDFCLDGEFGMKTLFPDETGTDGFFIAKIVRKV